MADASTLAIEHTEEHKGEKYRWLIALTKELPAISTVVVHPCDQTSLAGVLDAAKAEIIVPTIVGPEDRIKAVAAEHDLDLSGCEIVDASHSDASAAPGSARHVVRS